MPKLYRHLFADIYNLVLMFTYSDTTESTDAFFSACFAFIAFPPRCVCHLLMGHEHGPAQFALSVPLEPGIIRFRVHHRCFHELPARRASEFPSHGSSHFSSSFSSASHHVFPYLFDNRLRNFRSRSPVFFLLVRHSFQIRLEQVVL